MSRLATVGGLGAEALAQMELALRLDSTDPVQAIQEFAAVARARQIARQLGWTDDLPELDALYSDLASTVHLIIEGG